MQLLYCLEGGGGGCGGLDRQSWNAISQKLGGNQRPGLNSVECHQCIYLTMHTFFLGPTSHTLCQFDPLTLKRSSGNFRLDL